MSFDLFVEQHQVLSTFIGYQHICQMHAVMDKVMIISFLVSFVTSNKDLVVEQQQPHANDLPNLDLPQKLPSFCNGIQCPGFRILNKTEVYELREYPATSWMATQLKGVSYKQASYTMFMRLFRYIQGANAAKKKIPMTCPVITRIIPGPSATCESDFVMGFYNDPAEGDVPDPTDKTVFVKNLPRMQVYVRSFGGFAGYEDYRDAGVKMGKALEQDGLGDTFIKNYYYTAGYDAPYKLFDRHNEVWFVKK